MAWARAHWIDIISPRAAEAHWIRRGGYVLSSFAPASLPANEIDDTRSAHCIADSTSRATDSAACGVDMTTIRPAPTCLQSRWSRCSLCFRKFTQAGGINAGEVSIVITVSSSASPARNLDVATSPLGEFGADGVGVQDDHLTVERHHLRLHVQGTEPVEVVVNDVGAYHRNALGIAQDRRTVRNPARQVDLLLLGDALRDATRRAPGRGR